MPSGHVAFAVMVAAGLWMTSRRALIRGATLAYPVLVVTVVMATANHFWLDAVAGALAAVAGLGAATALRRAASSRRVAMRSPGGARREARRRLPGAPAHASPQSAR